MSKIDIQRESKQITNHSDSKEIHAQNLIEECAMELRVPGDSYLGSWAIHIYQSDISRSIAVRIQQHLNSWIDDNGVQQGVTEQIALMSLQEADRQLRATYGKARK